MRRGDRAGLEDNARAFTACAHLANRAIAGVGKLLDSEAFSVFF